MPGAPSKDPPFYVQSEQVRGERRQHWVEDRRIELRYRKAVTELTTHKRTAERQCEKLNEIWKHQQTTA